jgi:hypothetical protein
VGKYAPLGRFLRDSGKEIIEVGMGHIAAMLDGGLPRSAYDRARRMPAPPARRKVTTPDPRYRWLNGPADAA